MWDKSRLIHNVRALEMKHFLIYLLLCRFNGIAEMSITIERFPVYFKQVSRPEPACIFVAMSSLIIAAINHLSELGFQIKDSKLSYK